MKRELGILAFGLLSGAFLIPYEVEVPKNVKAKTPPRPKNHKRYVLNGVEVWALSEKRAIDKYSKKHGVSPILFE